MYCIARSHVFRDIPPNVKEALALRNGIALDDAPITADEGASDFAAHLRAAQVLFWPGPHVGTSRTFWIYFELAFCLRSTGQVLVRRHERPLLVTLCADLAIPVAVSDAALTLPDGLDLPVSAARAAVADPPAQAMLRAFLSALCLVYAARASPIGHRSALRFKRRHFRALERASAAWDVAAVMRDADADADAALQRAHPYDDAGETQPRHTRWRTCDAFAKFVAAAYAPRHAVRDDWDTALWRAASHANPWPFVGRFDEREAARVLDVDGRDGTRISVRLFKAAYSRRGGPYMGSLGAAFAHHVAGMGLRPDVLGAVDFDELADALAALDLGDGEGSSPPWVVDWISTAEDGTTGETTVKVNLAWARHEGDERAPSVERERAMLAAWETAGEKGHDSGNGADGSLSAEYILDIPPEEEEVITFRRNRSQWEDPYARRLRVVRDHRDLFDWLSVTAMKMLDTRNIAAELRSLTPAEVDDYIPGLDALRYWAVGRHERDLEAKLALACSGVCRTCVPEAVYRRRVLSRHGVEKMAGLRRWLWNGRQARVAGGEDPAMQDEVVKGVFPSVTVGVTIGTLIGAAVYVATAVILRDVSFEDAIQACLAMTAFIITPYFTVLHSRFYGGWSVVGSLGGTMTARDCIDKETFKCLAGQRAELKEMLLLQRRDNLEGYYHMEDGGFVGSEGGRVELQYTYSVQEVERLVEFGYNLRGTLCVKTGGLHAVWKTTEFDEDSGFRVMLENETSGFVRPCRVAGNVGLHRIV